MDHVFVQPSEKRPHQHILSRLEARAYAAVADLSPIPTSVETDEGGYPHLAFDHFENPFLYGPNMEVVNIVEGALSDPNLQPLSPVLFAAALNSLIECEGYERKPENGRDVDDGCKCKKSKASPQADILGCIFFPFVRIRLLL